jgi:hypothetical protein
MSRENVVPDGDIAAVLVPALLSWGMELTLLSSLLLAHVSVWSGAEHNNILPLISPVPSDMADEGSRSNINTDISILLLLLINVRSILLGSTVSVVTGLCVGWQFDCRQGQEMILLSKMGHTQPPIQ